MAELNYKEGNTVYYARGNRNPYLYKTKISKVLKNGNIRVPEAGNRKQFHMYRAGEFSECNPDGYINSNVYFPTPELDAAYRNQNFTRKYTSTMCDLEKLPPEQKTVPVQKLLTAVLDFARTPHTGPVVWKDETSYSQGERGHKAPDAWGAEIGGVKVFLTTGHIMARGDWVCHIREFGIDTHVLAKGKDLTEEQAKNALLNMLVELAGKKIAQLQGVLATVAAQK